MKLSTVVSDIRQLCCMGLGGEAIMPALFDQIPKVVPSDFNIFFWTDERCHMANMYCQNLPAIANVAKLYLTEFVDKGECEVKPSFSQLMRTERGIINWERFYNRRYFRSDFYNLILRPLRARHIVGTVIHERNRALGELVMWRAAGGPSFSDKEQAQLLRLAPYIAHGLARAETKPVFAESGKRGMIVLNPRGEIEYACPQAQELLFWATHPQVAHRFIKRDARLTAPPALVRLCKDLARIFQGADAPVPVAHHDNTWGRFTFRAYSLNHNASGRQALIGVTVDFEQPVSLKLFLQMQALGLSSKRREVCRLLLAGYSQPQVAQRLNISLNTLVDHVRHIYAKLGVHNRDELLQKFSLQTTAPLAPDR